MAGKKNENERLNQLKSREIQTEMHIWICLIDIHYSQSILKLLLLKFAHWWKKIGVEFLPVFSS